MGLHSPLTENPHCWHHSHCSVPTFVVLDRWRSGGNFICIWFWYGGVGLVLICFSLGELNLLRLWRDEAHEWREGILPALVMALQERVEEASYAGSCSSCLSPVSGCREELAVNIPVKLSKLSLLFSAGYNDESQLYAQCHSWKVEEPQFKCGLIVRLLPVKGMSMAK